MYRRRFQNRKKRKLLRFGDRFSLIHLGGGDFLYSFKTPQKSTPVLKRLNFRRPGHAIPGYGLLFLGGLVLTTLFFSDVGTADTISVEELKKIEAGLTPLEFEEQSERLKQDVVGEKGPSARKPGINPMTEYTVRPGDTLSGIATRYRVPIEMITASSRIRINSILRPGQKLTIPTRRGLIYKVKNGDRLAAVASYYSVKVEAIQSENPGLESLDLLRKGDRIFLPNAKIPAPPPVWFRPAWGRLTSYYGWRRHPVHGKRRKHTGLDIGLAYGSVRAARSGHIVYAGWMGSYGKTVVIEHTGGYKTLYAHLSRYYVRKGQYIKARKVIARSGNSGLSTGPHLHFEIIRYGRSFNPRKKIRF